MKYPCDCADMKWMINNNKVFKKEDGQWILSWIELDKTGAGIYIEKFGVRFDHCMFCGRKIEG
jgi:hypothetical protein